MSLSIEELEARGIYDKEDQYIYLESEYDMNYPNVYTHIYEKSMFETESSHEWFEKKE